MTYTLKLDWAYERAAAAGGAFRRARLDWLADALSGLSKPGDEWTFKLEWNATEINAARHALGAEIMRLERAMDDGGGSPPGPSFAELVASQNQIWAARRDIETYLVTSEYLSDVSQAALAERPL